MNAGGEAYCVAELLKCSAGFAGLAMGSMRGGCTGADTGAAAMTGAAAGAGACTGVGAGCGPGVAAFQLAGAPGTSAGAAGLACAGMGVMDGAAAVARVAAVLAVSPVWMTVLCSTAGARVGAGEPELAGRSEIADAEASEANDPPHFGQNLAWGLQTAWQ